MVKVAIFPYDFEYISTVKHRDLLINMDICYLLAPKGFALNGMAADYLENCDDSIKIQDTMTEEEYAEIDAVVIVDSVLKIPADERFHCLDMILKRGLRVINTVYDEKFNCTLKELCIKKKIEIIDSIDYIASERRITLKSVGIPSERNRISIPLIAICGMAPMTQKFDLELYFRSHLLHNGYRVSQIGTRKISNLFGFQSWDKELFDNSFSECEKILRINQYIKDIEDAEQPDVFVIGIPDSLMPYTQKHTFMYGIPAYEIFSAVSPDYAVLSLFNGEYTDDFYGEMVNVCNYRYNFDVDCFYNSCYVPVSLSVNANNLSYTYAKRVSSDSEKYKVFNTDDIQNMKMYEHMIKHLGNYGIFETY